VRASAFLARDGLLTYGDGRETWQEIRPREELLRAVRSFDTAPLTDLHPDAMVTADTWESLARGIVVAGTPHVTDPDEDGISYLAADILITSRDMLDTIRDGQAELSIGFLARITDAPEGTGARFAQVDMLGNHVASVPRGRAGPACRVFLDHAAVCAYDRTVDSRTDVQPVDQIEYPMPDGTIEMVSTKIAALLTQMQSTIETLSEQATEPEPEEPEMPDPAMTPPETPADPAAAAQPAEPAAQAPVHPPEEDPNKRRDAQGVRIDAETAKALIVERMPWLDGKLDSAEDLAPLLRAALAAPRADAAPVPAVQPEPVRVQARTDATAKPIANFLAQYGYAPRR